MTKIRFAAFSLVIFSVLSLSAQHSCGTDAYYHQQLQKFPDLAKSEKTFNEEAARYEKLPHSRAAIYTIPVVFHVIHTNGPENISREQIMDQMRVLNADFNFLNPNKSKIRSDFQSVTADCQVKFVLAAIDPNGNCTDGINRVYSPLGVEVDQSTEEVKEVVQWDYRKYLNIWVVTSIASTGNGTILGYAQFPWSNQPSTDGIVMRHDRVGTIGTGAGSDSGRTLTHELGHWLGLYHTFQDGCNGGDLCDDTPPVASTFINANCPANGNSCTNDNPDLPDQWENFMDYSDGKCMSMFTKKQKARMHSFFGIFPRNGNVSASNLSATGVTLSTTAPVASFGSSHRIICVGEPVTFYDQSCKSAVTARSWTLAGSSVPSSTAVSPVVVYQAAGKYKVSLVVQNAAGSNTKTIDQYIEVISPSVAISPNFEEGFEAENPESRGYISVSPKSWEVVSTAAYTGSKSFKAPVSSSDDAGTNYSFVLPPVNLSILENAGLQFTFYAAYAPSFSGTSEILRAYVSTDCGNSFRQILERSGSGLYFNGATATSNFVPNASNQWKLMGVTSLSNLGITSSEIAIFRIDVIGAKGNPVYVDNINISPYRAGLNNLNGKLQVSLYPNPAADKATLSFEMGAPTQTTIAVYDAAGRKVKDIFTGILAKGEQKFEIGKPETAAGTLYFVKIATPEGQITKPLTFVP